MKKFVFKYKLAGLTRESTINHYDKAHAWTMLYLSHVMLDKRMAYNNNIEYLACVEVE